MSVSQPLSASGSPAPTAPLRPEQVDGRSARFVAATGLDAFAPHVVAEPWLSGSALEAVLSQDRTSGETTSILTVPACGPGPEGSFAGAVELFVLDGSLTIGDRTLGKYGYACIPGGAVDGPFSTVAGCRVAVFTSGPRRFVPGPQEPVGPSLPHVTYVDAYEEPWRSTAETLPGVLPPGLLVKPLVQNEATGAITFLSGSIMRRMTGPNWETHPHFEEQLYLEGEFDQLEVLELGVTPIHYAGPGYSFRPADVAHLGPGCGTDSFCLRVVRVPRRLLNVHRAEAAAYPARYLPSVLAGGD